jgi:hypothetical protein
MSSGYIFGMLGAALLLVGAFLPIASIPVWGEINLFQLSEYLALELVLIGALHLIFCIRQWWWGLYITKLGIAAALVFGIYENWDAMMGNTSFLGRIASQIIDPVTKFHYGIGVLVGGILVLLVAPIPKRPPKQIKPPRVVQRAEQAETVMAD